MCVGQRSPVQCAGTVRGSSSDNTLWCLVSGRYITLHCLIDLLAGTATMVTIPQTIQGSQYIHDIKIQVQYALQ